jgi:hypothetical protein
VTAADQFVCAHNAVRARAPGADPPLDDVAWSGALARRAQDWADACAFRHSDATDVGENLARGSSLSPAEAVALWASERALYDPTTGECAGSDRASCLHYAAIVSRNVTRIGCGVARCPFEEGPGDFVVCHYLPVPRGTYRGETAYEPSAPKAR